MLKLERLRTYGYQANCYLLWDDTSGKGFLIDPSVSVETIEASLAEHGVTLEMVLLTHGHFDHIISVDAVRERFHVPVCIHAGDAEFLTDPLKNASALLIGEDQKYEPAEILLHDGDRLTLGSETVRVIASPGHSPGSVCFEAADFMLTGDTLFCDNIGRTDLYGGDPRVLCASLQRLVRSEKDVPIHPGHGYPGKLMTAALPAISWLRGSF